MAKQSNTSIHHFNSALSVGGAGTAWSTPGNVQFNDSSSATAALAASGTTQGLYCYASFPGLFATYPNVAVPTTAVIDGVQIDVDRFGGSGANLKDLTVQLMKNVGGSSYAQVGTNKAVSAFWPAATGTLQSYGGPTDLWGTTLLASDILDPNFGIVFYGQNTNATTGYTASVQYMQITVFFHVGNQQVQKRYQIKTYTRQGAYLGQLPQSSSVYSQSQDINTAGGQITISTPVTIDTAALQSGGTVQDESGNDVQDENGNALLTEGAVPMVSVGTGSGVIRNGNRIVVIETSYWYPNGRIMFKGFIENWSASIGDSDEITILAYADGSDLDWYPLIGPPYTATVDQTQVTNAETYFTVSESGGPFLSWAQVFTVGTGVTNLGQILLKLQGTADVTLNIYSLISGVTTFVATVTQNVNVTSFTDITFNLPSHIAVTAGVTYFLAVKVGSGQTMFVAGTSLNPYSGGAVYYQNYSGTGALPPFTLQSTGQYDFYFKTFSTNGNTTANYTSLDPSTMLKSFMDDYKSRGGLIYYNSTSVDLTGLTLSYSMTTNTVLDGINAMLNLAPDGFYWYVDVATDTLYFKNSSTTADVTFIKGRHINNIDLTASIENVVNYELFSGGDTGGGVNLYKAYADNGSIALYGQRLARKSDNRVTVSATADAIGQSDIATQKDEAFQTTIKLNDAQIDTAGLNVGLIVGFRGFGTFVDSLLMQIVSIQYSPEETTVTLGVLPKQSTLHTEQILRELIALQTIDNPVSPS